MKQYHGIYACFFLFHVSDDRALCKPWCASLVVIHWYSWRFWWWLVMFVFIDLKWPRVFRCSTRSCQVWQQIVLGTATRWEILCPVMAILGGQLKYIPSNILTPLLNSSNRDCCQWTWITALHWIIPQFSLTLWSYSSAFQIKWSFVTNLLTTGN